MLHTQFIQKLEKNYDNVFNYTGGNPSLRMVTSLAAQYTYVNRTYSGLEHQAMMDRITSGESMFSIFQKYRSNSNLVYKIAAHLLLKENAEQHVIELKKKDSILAECGFRPSPYRLVSAFFVKDTAHGVRAKKLYDEMNKFHPILTRKSDFPFAILLTANNDDSIALRAETMNRYFHKLRELGFSLGDALQTLTQILALFDVHYNEELVYYVAQLKTELENRGVHVKRVHYPYIGMLALTATKLQLIEEIVKLEKQLQHSKATRGVRELALVLAIQYLVRDYQDAQHAVNSTTFTSWLELFQFSEFFLYISFDIANGLTDLFDIDLNF